MSGFEPILLLIPVINGLIGYVTNFIAVRLLFWPVEFIGVRFPGLQGLVPYLPRKLQAIPGFAHGGIGWQGIIPSRSPKMGSIAVDKGISKLGTPAEFYRQLEPEKIAQHMVASSQEEIRELVEEIVAQEHPDLMRDVPEQIRTAVFDRVIETELPGLVGELTDAIGDNIDHLLDVKVMVIRQIGENPAIANKVSQGIGDKELGFVINSGLLFGFLLGLPQVAIFSVYDAWWVLAAGGVTVGLLTNWMALKLIFHPMRPRRLGPFKVQGMFMRRQPEVSQSYAKVVAEDIVTLQNIGHELLHGPQSDRTRALIKRTLRPAVDRAVGMLQPAVRVAVGSREYDRIRERLSDEAIGYTMNPLSDPEFNRQQAESVKALLSERIMELPPDDYAELLRGAIREDEWMLIALGAELGFVVGAAQVLLYL